MRQRLFLVSVVSGLLLLFSVDAQAAVTPLADTVLLQARRDETVRVIVTVRASSSQPLVIHRAQERLLQYMQGYRVRITQQLKYIPKLGLEVDRTALRRIRRYPAMYSIHEDKEEQPLLIDSTTIIGAQSAWQDGYSGNGQTMAVLDTGIDSTHEFLSGKVTEQACFSSGPVSLCPNGQPVDITSADAGEPCDYDSCDHGTHVAGIAAGAGTNFNGVAKDAKLISIQVFSEKICSDGKPCITSYQIDTLAALDYVYDMRNNFTIAAVNISLGDDNFYSAPCDTDDRKDTIDALRNAGIATVIAAGNIESNQTYQAGLSSPACISSAVSVGNTTKSDVVYKNSKSADYLDLLAPGTEILSSVPNNMYEEKIGTSMAAPHVAGAIAVLRSADPAISVNDIETNLKETGLLITDPKSGVTTPRIDVAAAVVGACTVPTTGDWIVTEECAIQNTVTMPGNVIVLSGVVLHIMNGARFDVDFDNHYLKIEHGGGVRLRDYSTID